MQGDAQLAATEELLGKIRYDFHGEDYRGVQGDAQVAATEELLGKIR